jgi:hypothetical protein
MNIPNLKLKLSLIVLTVMLSDCSLFHPLAQSANSPTAVAGRPDKNPEWARQKLAE